MSGSSKLSNEDIELFRQSVGSVKLLKQENILPPVARPKPFPRQTDIENQNVLNEMLSGEIDHAELETGDELLFARPGVQKQTLKKLRRGHYSIGEELDLHGMTSDIANKELSAFISSCKQRRIRTVRIIHGKGLGSVNKQPVLKNKINLWLRQFDDVLAFCSARPTDGGTGAAYVLIKIK